MTVLQEIRTKVAENTVGRDVCLTGYLEAVLSVRFVCFVVWLQMSSEQHELPHGWDTKIAELSTESAVINNQDFHRIMV